MSIYLKAIQDSRKGEKSGHFLRDEENPKEIRWLFKSWLKWVSISASAPPKKDALVRRPPAALQVAWLMTFPEEQ